MSYRTYRAESPQGIRERRLGAGFTIVELMVTVAIIAILASIAVPSYSDYVLRGRITEATTALQDARLKMEQYFQDNRTYAASSTTSITNWSGGNTACGFNGPTEDKFKFTCTAAATTFTITATGKTGQAMAGFTYKIDQANTRTTDATTWGKTSTSCWVIRRDGACS